MQLQQPDSRPYPDRRPPQGLMACSLWMTLRRERALAQKKENQRLHGHRRKILSSGSKKAGETGFGLPDASLAFAQALGNRPAVCTLRFHQQVKVIGLVVDTLAVLSQSQGHGSFTCGRR